MNEVLGRILLRLATKHLDAEGGAGSEARERAFHRACNELVLCNDQWRLRQVFTELPTFSTLGPSDISIVFAEIKDRSDEVRAAFLLALESVFEPEKTLLRILRKGLPPYLDESGPKGSPSRESACEKIRASLEKDGAAYKIGLTAFYDAVFHDALDWHEWEMLAHAIETDREATVRYTLVALGAVR